MSAISRILVIGLIVGLWVASTPVKELTDTPGAMTTVDGRYSRNLPQPFKGDSPGIPGSMMHLREKP